MVHAYNLNSQEANRRISRWGWPGTQSTMEVSLNYTAKPYLKRTGRMEGEREERRGKKINSKKEETGILTIEQV